MVDESTQAMLAACLLSFHKQAVTCNGHYKPSKLGSLPSFHHCYDCRLGHTPCIVCARMHACTLSCSLSVCSWC